MQSRNLDRGLVVIVFVRRNDKNWSLRCRGAIGRSIISGWSPQVDLCLPDFSKVLSYQLPNFGLLFRSKVSKTFQALRTAGFQRVVKLPRAFVNLQSCIGITNLLKREIAD